MIKKANPPRQNDLNKVKSLSIITVTIVLFLSMTAALATDLPNSKDHPLIKRFAGSEIVGYDVKRFDDYSHLLLLLTLDEQSRTDS